jgi:hypothetical protein
LPLEIFDKINNWDNILIMERMERNEEKIPLKYRVLLVHGAGLRGKTFGINYYGHIPKEIKKRDKTIGS